MNIRLWPAWGMVLVAAALVATAPFLVTRTMMHFLAVIAAPILATFGILLWWLTFSRVRGVWRWWPVLVFVCYGAGFYWIVYHGDKDFLKVLLYHAPIVALAWVLWLMLSRRLSMTAQCMGVVAVVILGWAASSLVRIDQTDAEMVPELRWAWRLSNRELFEREQVERSQRAAHLKLSESVEVRDGDWPGFRGPNRDGVAKSRVRTDWKANPPKPLWRQRVGAGWGSFAVVGDRIFTQEQRGNDEAVVCYHADTGQDLWVARIPGRFFEGIAGEGPRATPSIHDGKCYAFSATGKLVALDAVTGKQFWLADVVADVDASVPQWGFASSPLVIGDRVIVFAAAPEKGTVAYSLDGKLAWAAGAGLHGYSSPHRVSLNGVEQVVQVSDFGIEAFRPDDGHRLWHHAWTLRGQNRVAQPAIINENEILLGTAVGGGQGARRLRVNKDAAVEVVWESRSPKPYFNDGVVFGKHYYGWDDRNFVCVDLKNGKIKWNAGSNYGFGQVLLLKEQNLLLVQKEDGGVTLVEATPEEFIEAAKFAAIEGKTWNHPVVAHGRLYVRNGAEAACYDISEPGK